MSARHQSELELLHEVDDQCVRLRALRRLLTGQLAFLGTFFWLSALWPARFARIEVVARWLWMAAAAAMLVVLGCELVARRRFQKLIDVRGADER
jgi:hypothetical protein